MEKNVNYARKSKCVAVVNNVIVNLDIDKVENIFNSYGEKTSVRIHGICNGERYVVAPCNCYANIDDFKEGKVLELASAEAAYNGVSAYNEGKVYYFAFVNGAPENRSATPRTISRTKSKWVFDVDYESTPYLSRQECLDHNIVIEMKDDGTKVEHIGSAKLIALDDDQKKAVDMLKDAFKKAHELGVRFVLETETETFSAFNTRNIKEWSWDCAHENVSKYLTEVDIAKPILNTYLLNDCPLTIERE